MAREFVLDHLDRSGPQNTWVSLAETFQMSRFSAFTQLSEARSRAPPIGAQRPEQQGEAIQVGPVPAFAFCATKKSQNSTLCFSPNRFLAKVSSNQSNEPGERELSGQDGGAQRAAAASTGPKCCGDIWVLGAAPSHTSSFG